MVARRSQVKRLREVEDEQRVLLTSSRNPPQVCSFRCDLATSLAYEGMKTSIDLAEGLGFNLAEGKKMVSLAEARKLGHEALVSDFVNAHLDLEALRSQCAGGTDFLVNGQVVFECGHPDYQGNNEV